MQTLRQQYGSCCDMPELSPKGKDQLCPACLNEKECDMQASQVKEYFPSVERYINNAAQLCQITSDVPDNLRDYLSELDRESDQAKTNA
jgi:hypothetical protein